MSVAFLLGTALAPAHLAAAHVGGPVTEDNKMFFMAPFLQVPIAKTPPAIDGVLSPSEWPDYSARELPDGGTLRIAHNDSTVFVDIDYPGTGWAAIAWSGLGTGPVQVAIGWLENGTLNATDAYAENLTMEVENAPDMEIGGTADIVASASTAHSGRTTLELALRLETQDTFDPPMEVGEIHTVMAAFNQTATEMPRTLDEGTQVFFRAFLDRPDDSPAEVASLFAESVSPLPALVAVAVIVGSAAWIGVPMIRRRAS